MLKLVELKKDYIIANQPPVNALKGITLNFRRNEFVAVLGPSGCGKTTLLNLIGGLDRSTDGELIIEGKSTKNYGERDWDTYRNHSIGFVFQTYNLITHQTILKNVELALTISGVKKEERTRRAKEALDLVGLKGLYNKKPNQMSGGQMQRVAIARALINNPEIVLADEPTGALDSETSVQIMDIMKEIAKDHLVIMVTHNPELADAYASRIVRMKDGEILSDSNPYAEEYVEEEVQQDIQINKGKKKQSSMSFITATSLSVSNLLSKIKRTILVSLAGSIGIIGVSAILGVSNGVNNYIYDMQDDMLSRYPLAITEESLDLTSIVSGVSDASADEIPDFDITTSVGLDSMISWLMTKYTDFTNLKTNDIDEDLVTYISDMPSQYYSAMTYDYGIDPTNNIFTTFREKKDSEDEDFISINGLTKRYISTLMTVDGFENYSAYVELFTNFMRELPEEEEYIMDQYDLIAGDKFATKENEIMLVVDDDTTLTDLVFAQMGYYPQDEFLNISKKAVMSNFALTDYLNGNISKAEYEAKLAEYAAKYQYKTSFTFDELLARPLYYYPHDALYKQNPSFVSHKQAVASISGLDASGNRYIMSLTYIPSNDYLTGTYIVLDSSNVIVSNQYCLFYRNGSRDTEKSVLDGQWVGGAGQSLSEMSALIFMNLETANATSEDNTTYYEFNKSTSSIMINYTTPVAIDSGKVTEIEPHTPDYYYEAYLQDNDQVAGKQISEIEGAQEMKVVGILRAKKGTNFGTLYRGVYYSHAFAEKYIRDSQNSEIVNTFKNHITSKEFLNSTFNAYVHYHYDSYENDDGSDDFVPEVVDGYSSSLNGDFSTTLYTIFFSFLGSGDDNLETESIHMRALCGLKIVEDNDDYDVELLPQEIDIYPANFKTKKSINKYLDKWNEEVDITLSNGKILTPNEREDLAYSDTIGIIINVISTLINVISIALIAFTSLSLVVSCFMIAVITYISVMERVKEIGVIRSLGGRKKDVSRLFTAENLITGLASGIIGIFFTYIIQLIINLIVAPYGVSHICALPFTSALIMIGISVLLSVISGFIPSRSASKQDPVVALRTE